MSGAKRTDGSEALRRLEPYPAYRDSGVQWLGEIPTHWEVKKVKRLCLVRRGASPRPIDDPIYFDDEGEYAWVRIADVTASERYLERTTQRLSNLGKSKSVALEPGELFVSIAATVGKPVITKIKCCIHDGFVYFVGLHENREFLFYLFSCGEPYKGLGKLGTQLNLNTDTIGDIYLPRPASAEQESIVQFLDRETARIDALVARKERLIELLQEQRTALISDCVTGKAEVRRMKDENGNSSFIFHPSSLPKKDSGVEWLGEIPAHWGMSHLKYAASRIIDCPHETPTYADDGDQYVIRTADISEGRLDLSNARRVDDVEFRRRVRRLTIVADDIVYSREGERFGFGALVPEGVSVCLGQRMMQFRASSNWSPRFLMWQLNARSTYQQACLDTAGATSPHVNVGTIRNFWLSQPPLSEQHQIAIFVDRETAAFDALIARVREAIDCLKELRTALISAAVTGKIDVREG